MDYPWVDNIKQKGELGVYRDGSISGMWSTVFHQSIAEFNRLSSHHKLGVILKESKHAPVEAGGGADVKVATANGPVAFNYGGEDHPSTVNGHGLHGLTIPAYRVTAITVVEKAFIFLPQQPQISAPKGMVNAGVNIMKIILIHEFIHACGLGKHSTDDVFEGVHTISGDTVRAGGATMPPIFISGATASRIQGLWT